VSYSISFVENPIRQGANRHDSVLLAYHTIIQTIFQGFSHFSIPYDYTNPLPFSLLKIDKTYNPPHRYGK
jgi:hypothetical protein